jgi:hypothetical protein
VKSHERLINPDCQNRRNLLESKARATLAQLVERLIRNQQVAGSIPAGGSKTSLETKHFRKAQSSCRHRWGCNCAKTPSRSLSCARTPFFIRLSVDLCERLAFHLQLHLCQSGRHSCTTTWFGIKGRGRNARAGHHQRGKVCHATGGEEEITLGMDPCGPSNSGRADRRFRGLPHFRVRTAYCLGGSCFFPPPR